MGLAEDEVAAIRDVDADIQNFHCSLLKKYTGMSKSNHRVHRELLEE
jgi:hypothetical protein